MCAAGANSSRPGVCVDADVTMSAHVTAIVRACFAALCQIRSVCCSLTRTTLLNVDTSARTRTYGHKGGLLQLSSLGYLRTTAAVCLQCCRSSRVLSEEVRALNSTPW